MACQLNHLFINNCSGRSNKIKRWGLTQDYSRFHHDKHGHYSENPRLGKKYIN